MRKFKVGERVKVVYGYGWDGEGVVTSVTRGNFCNVKMETGEMEGCCGGFPSGDLEAITLLNLDDLRRVVDSLRSQGYDVDPINVTEPAPQHTI